MRYNDVGRYYNLTYKSFSLNHSCIDCVSCQLCYLLVAKIRLGDSAYTRLDSSVRRKTRKCAEVTKNSICTNAHNSGNYETRLKCSQRCQTHGPKLWNLHVKIMVRYGTCLQDACAAQNSN